MTSGKLLRPESVTQMTTPVRLNNGQTVGHGLGWFIDTFNGHTFGAHWGTTVTGHSSVIRRYTNDGVTVIMLANLDDGGLGIDAMSKRIADMYVRGVAVQGLKPVTEDRALTERMRTALNAIAAGVDGPDVVAGFPAALPQPVRTRLAEALRSPGELTSLGEERLTERHFNLDPAVERFRWYRAGSASARRYLTVRLTAEGKVKGVLIEDE